MIRKGGTEHRYLYFGIYTKPRPLTPPTAGTRYTVVRDSNNGSLFAVPDFGGTVSGDSENVEEGKGKHLTPPPKSEGVYHSYAGCYGRRGLEASQCEEEKGM